MDYQRLRIARGRSKIGKADAQEEEQLENIREQFEEVSRFLGDRLLSLRQGRPRSLITQAARHHAAQVTFFLLLIYLFIFCVQLHVDFACSLSGLYYAGPILGRVKEAGRNPHQRLIIINELTSENDLKSLAVYA